MGVEKSLQNYSKGIISFILFFTIMAIPVSGFSYGGAPRWLCCLPYEWKYCCPCGESPGDSFSAHREVTFINDTDQAQTITIQYTRFHTKKVQKSELIPAGKTYTLSSLGISKKRASIEGKPEKKIQSGQVWKLSKESPEDAPSAE